MSESKQPDNKLTLIDNKYTLFNTKTAQNVVQKYPRSQYECEIDKIKKYIFVKYRYGTSGFRSSHKILDSIMLRVSLLGILRSISHGNKGIGLMITASHNIEIDNGVKIIDENGEMLDESWELIATKIANLDEKNVLTFLDNEYNNLIKKNNIKFINNEPCIFIGRDTRPHSLKFNKIMIEIAKAINIKVNIRDMGEVTTPQLHYIVMRGNIIGINKVEPNIYLKEVLSSFTQMFKLLNKTKKSPETESKKDENDTKTSSKQELGKLIVDCANGVGGIIFKESLKLLSNYIDLTLIHIPSKSVKVNDNCGAEHVHKQRKLPNGLKNKEINKYKNIKMASIDGDCDRLMYYTVNNDGNIIILDGDKQICLFYAFLNGFIKIVNNINKDINISIGVVQTAYANGASSNYIEKKLGLKTVFTPTGVKYLHHKAKEYDIAIYFEANGHGTVLVSKNAVNKLNQLKKTDKLKEEQINAISVLLLLYNVSNQAIGDAFCDLLLVELSLYYLNWDINKWNNIYNELPMLLTKLKVKDRLIFKTTNAEQTCLEPKGLQKKIDELIKKYKNGRAFVRPSGTEDCVRVYSEALTQNDADKLNLEIRQAVYDIAGGVGKRPTQ